MAKQPKKPKPVGRPPKRKNPSIHKVIAQNKKNYLERKAARAAEALLNPVPVAPKPIKKPPQPRQKSTNKAAVAQTAPARLKFLQNRLAAHKKKLEYQKRIDRIRNFQKARKVESAQASHQAL